MMTEEQARQSSFSNIITRALGIRPKVEMTVEKIPYKKVIDSFCVVMAFGILCLNLR